MRESEQKNCPLCSVAAEYYLVDHGNVKYFKCPSCNYFQVSLRAEKHVIGAPQWLRDRLLEQVKQTPEDYLLVIEYEASKNDSGEPEQSLRGRFLPKSELSL